MTTAVSGKGMNAYEIIEAIAKQWFATSSSPTLRPDIWDKQPDEIKEQFRKNARIFWQKPSRPYRDNAHRLYLLKGLLVDYNRGYLDGIALDSST